MPTEMRAIKSYKSASKYLDDHLNGYGKIPEKEWRAGLAELLTGRTAQVERYYKICDDVKNAEALRRGAEKIMREDTEREVPAKGRDMAL